MYKTTKIGLGAILLGLSQVSQAAFPFQMPSLDMDLSAWYAGSDLGVLFISYETSGTVDYNDVYANDLRTFTPWVGYRLHPAVALEAGWSMTENQKQSIDTTTTLGVALTGDTKVHIHTWFMDMMTRHEIDESWYALGGLGVEYYHYNVDTAINPAASVGFKTDAKELGYRFSVGVEYQCTDKWSVRALGRAVKADFNDMAAYYTHWSLGAHYDF